MPPGWAAVLAALAIAAVLANGAVAAAITEQVTTARGVMVQQAALAANNSGVGSGPVTLGVRIAMLRSWRVSDTGIAVAVAVINVVGTTRLWLATLAVSVAAAGGAADGVVARWVVGVAAAAALVVLVGHTALWWLLLERPSLLDRIASTAQRAAIRLTARRPRGRALVERVHLPAEVERFRVAARTTVRRRGPAITLAMVAEQAVLLALPIAVVRAFGIGPEVAGAREVLVAFVFVRTAAALTAVPGGIGVTEIGLTALLSRTGAPESSVLGAVLVYRAITFLLPIVVGTASFALWRHRRRRASAADPAAHGDPAVGGAEPVGEPQPGRPCEVGIGGQEAEGVTAVRDAPTERRVQVTQRVRVTDPAAVRRVAHHE